MKEEKDFSGVTHYTQVDVQPGGINIQNVEHLYQADILKQLGIELEVKRKEDEQPAGLPSDERLARAIEECQKYFWGNSAYAVVFCVLRDCFGMLPNKTGFERRVEELPYEKRRT